MKYRVKAGTSIKYAGRTYADGAVIADGELPLDHMRSLETAGLIIADEKTEQTEPKRERRK